MGPRYVLLSTAILVSGLLPPLPHILDHLLTSHNRTSPLITNPNSFAGFALSSSTQCTSAHCSARCFDALQEFHTLMFYHSAFTRGLFWIFLRVPFQFVLIMLLARVRQRWFLVFTIVYGWGLPYLILSWNVRNYATWCFLHFPEIHSIRPVTGQHPGSDNLARF